MNLGGVVADEQKQQRSKTLALFDIGAVLLELDYSTFFREAAKLSADGKSPEDFKEAYIAANLEPRFHAGQMSSGSYLNELQRLINPGRNLSEEELTALVGMRYTGAIDEVVEIKRRAHEAGYAVGLFSTTCELDVRIFNARYPEMMETFRPSNPRIFSFDAGSCKPEPPMYQRVQEFGFERVIFIDDKPSHIRAGVEEFGWKGILFTPYVDQAEAMRAVHSDTTIPQKDFRVADSVEELIDALRCFGVEV